MHSIAAEVLQRSEVTRCATSRHKHRAAIQLLRKTRVSMIAGIMNDQNAAQEFATAMDITMLDYGSVKEFLGRRPQSN
jgi:hypothetical protein